MSHAPGAIDEHGRQPWPGACLVSRKPTVREKHIPISTQPLL